MNETERKPWVQFITSGENWCETQGSVNQITKTIFISDGPVTISYFASSTTDQFVKVQTQWRPGTDDHSDSLVFIDDK